MRAAARLAMLFQVASQMARRRALHVMRRAIAPSAARRAATSSTASASRVASVKGVSSEPMLRLTSDTDILRQRATLRAANQERVNARTITSEV